MLRRPSLNYQLWTAIALLTATPIAMQAQRSAHHTSRRSHTSSSDNPAIRAPVRVVAAVLPVDSMATDSIQTIVARDLDFGDRVQIVPPEAMGTASVAIRTVRNAQGVTVSIVEPLSGIVRQEREFVLPVVTPPRDSILTDSLARDLASRSAVRQAELARNAGVADSLRAEIVKKPPKLRGSGAKKAYALMAAQRDSLLQTTIAQDPVIRLAAREDTVAHDSTLRVVLFRDAFTRDSLAQARRWAIHGIADEVQGWLTGQRGIAQSRVAYVSKGAVRVVDFDGANDHAVTHGEGAMSPAWRPDGRAVVYSDMNDAGTQIAWVDLVTGQTHQLNATKRGLNITPIFSGDGQWVMYANGDDAHTGIIAVRSDSTASLTATATSGQIRHIGASSAFDESEPVLSPDGSRVAYTSARPKTPLIYSSNLDGSDERVETPALTKARTYRTSPDWSPDGRMIAFEQQNGDFQVWVVDRTTRSMRKLTTIGENEDPSWAPDSRHVALTSTRGGDKAIWVLDVPSGRFRQLTPSGDARLAAWSRTLSSPTPTALASTATPTATATTGTTHR